MTFEEALPLLREGKIARCTWWVAGSYVFVRDNEFILVSRDGKEDFANLCSFDIDSNWEVFE